MRMTRLDMIQDLDAIVTKATDCMQVANLRGFLTRCEESAFYRRPPRGLAGSGADIPSNIDVERIYKTWRV